MDTKTEENTKKQSEEVVCAECGMPKSEWPHKGVVEDGAQFCCQGCADGTGCTCETEEASDE